MKAPAAQNRSSRQNGRQSIRFRECERVVTVTGSVAFATVASLPCNPGISDSFPWLSGHAVLFENYKIHKLIYRYKNLKGTASDGNILLSFDYDTLDSAPVSAIKATQSTHYTDGSPWRIFEFKVPTDNRKLFTRSGTIAGVDLKTYDMGQLFISTEGCADTSDHGYVEVEYDIEFFNKQPSDSVPAASIGPSSKFYRAGTQSYTAAGEIEFDTIAFNGLNLQAGVNPGEFILPVGTYSVTVTTQNDVAGIPWYVQLNGAKVVPDLGRSSKAGFENELISSLISVLVDTVVVVHVEWTSGTVVQQGGSAMTIVKL